MRVPANMSHVRTAGWGSAVIAAYLVAASFTLGSGRMPLRPFFEGTAPPQGYRWVTPPASLKAQNIPPDRGAGAAKLSAKGSEQATIGTSDGQATLALSPGSIKGASGETEVKILLEPLDANTLGPPPKNLGYDGNAYRVTATYARSGKPAEFAATDCPVGAQPKLCPTMVMRYAFGATGLYRRDGKSWTKIDGATPTPQSLQIFADVSAAGTFVATGPPRAETTPPSRVGDYIAIGISAVAIAVSIVAARSKTMRRRWHQWRKARRATAARPQGTHPPNKSKASKGNGKRKR